MAVTVLTDTTSALPRGVAQRWGIRLVPLTISCGGRSYRDGDVGTGHLLSQPGVTLHTAGPPPGEFSTASCRGLPPPC